MVYWRPNLGLGKVINIPSEIDLSPYYNFSCSVNSGELVIELNLDLSKKLEINELNF